MSTVRGRDVTVEFGLRPAREEDRNSLFALHRLTMRDVIARTWGWDEGWQRAHFDARFNPARISVVTAAGRDAGMLWLEIRPAEIYVAELQIAPEMQGRGLGSAVLGGVIASAAARASCVTLQVLEINEGARRLYQRLGFYVTGRSDRHVQMRHDAGRPRKASPIPDRQR
jgi:ribosomal protein S18 acetylase RimI-like enzyme